MKSLISLVLLSVAVPLIPPSYAQNPPARTYQPGFWRPVARFAPDKAVQVNIINNTDIPLEFDNTDVELTNPQSINPGETGKLQGFGRSAYIVIYPKVQVYGDFTLRFDLTIDEAQNTVNISVVKDKPTFFGHRAVNLQKTGAIFLH